MRAEAASPGRMAGGGSKGDYASPAIRAAEARRSGERSRACKRLCSSISTRSIRASRRSSRRRAVLRAAAGRLARPARARPARTARAIRPAAAAGADLCAAAKLDPLQLDRLRGGLSACRGLDRRLPSPRPARRDFGRHAQGQGQDRHARASDAVGRVRSPFRRRRFHTCAAASARSVDRDPRHRSGVGHLRRSAIGSCGRSGSSAKRSSSGSVPYRGRAGRREVPAPSRSRR